jgi:UDP-2,4-diacetamido-2,4,6-trideoxy-beta-L-altropyranose hydrolase
VRVVFRVDASMRIGTGHVMRCLTLAQSLLVQGVETHFICRLHEGHLIEGIRAQGHTVHALPHSERFGATTSQVDQGSSRALYSEWLAATQLSDAEACRAVLNRLKPNWLVVDHYGLDALWEALLAGCCDSIMVLDDLADRQHACQLLLDQTYARNSEDYLGKVPADCTVLCGAKYALLRPGFAALREASLSRRASPALKELLVSMGGVDEHNVSGKILSILCEAPLPSDCRITVVMGATAPWIEKIRTQALEMPWSTRVLVGVENMAQLMHDSDVAIGAVGSTTWERCSLGLPTGVVILAENQRFAAEQLMQAHAVQLLGESTNFHHSVIEFIAEMSNDVTRLAQLGSKASAITDGRGCERLIAYLLNKDTP